jgi:limonene-1,2-epoxide hydrolase
MLIKKFAMAGAAVSLLASTTAFADTAAKPAPVAKVAQIKRARAAADPRKAQNIAGLSLPVLAIGAVAVGVGIAAAAGAFSTSP